MRRGAAAPIELYDVTKDIGETENVAASHPEEIEEIEAAMQDAHVSSEIWKSRKR